jgi:hyperosmotically inducible periplasmic protein
MMNYRLLTLSISTVAVLGAVACSPREQEKMSSSARSTATEARQATEKAANRAERVIDDSVITTKVKSVLIADSTVKGLNISVDTVGGTVTLTGTAATQAERAQAEALAASVEGVRGVVNRISVS